MRRSRPRRHGGQIGYRDLAAARARDRAEKNGKERSGKAGMTVTQASVSAAGAVSDRVKRHLLVDRVYHWLMAACVLTLMATAFLPIIGYKFEWVGLHWTTGVALTLLVTVHIVRAAVWQDIWAMAIVATGLVMLLKIDTPLWRRDPYRLADSQWGAVYAVHGLAAMALITLV